MTQQNYNFYEDKIWIGEFTISGDDRKAKVSGEFIYNKNQTPYLEIVTLDESFLIPFVKPGPAEVKIDYIHGYVKDQKSEKNPRPLYVTLTNCITRGVAARRFVIYFDYALFSEDRFFTEDDALLNVEYFFNNWDEFNHAQCWKSEARYKRNEEVFNLKNNGQIKFCQSLDGYYIYNEDKIFDRLFFNGEGKISEKEIVEISDGLKNVLSKYLNKIFIKNSESHRWFMSLGGNLSLNIIPRISYYLTTLLTCLTHDFNTSLEEIMILSKIPGTEYSTRFTLLYAQPTIKTQKLHYNNINSVLKKNSFTYREWKTILDNLFDKIISRDDLLDNFFFALQENHLGGVSATPFCVTRAIDCLSGIADNKGYKGGKYQKVVFWFLNGLDKETQDLALQFIDEKLDYILIYPSIENGKSQKDGPCNKLYNFDQVRGKKISELRTISVHFGDKNKSNQNMDLQKAHALLYVFELMIIDFIFEELKVPQRQRSDYKKFYLERVSWF